MDNVLREMIEIYKPNGIDWMGYHYLKKNPYTYHHIREARNGGKRTLKNGAILTHNAHCYLNVLDCKYHKVYLDLNYMFLCLNKTELPPAKEYFEEIDHILKRVRR